MSPRPGRIAGIVDIDLPQPRSAETREEPRFFELVTEVREMLRGRATDSTGRGRAVSTVAVPEPGRSLARGVGAQRPGLAPCARRPRRGHRRLGGLALDVFDIKRFLLPQPSGDRERVLGRARELLAAGWFTFQEALGVSSPAASLAILAALVLARWRPLGRALMPYSIAANAVPIIAFAPITNAWFGPSTRVEDGDRRRCSASSPCS